MVIEVQAYLCSASPQLPPFHHVTYNLVGMVFLHLIAITIVLEVKMRHTLMHAKTPSVPGLHSIKILVFSYLFAYLIQSLILLINAHQ